MFPLRIELRIKIDTQVIQRDIGISERWSSTFKPQTEIQGELLSKNAF